MDRAMASAEEAYLTEPEHRQWCSCGTQKKNGVCPECDGPDFSYDDKFEFQIERID